MGKKTPKPVRSLLSKQRTRNRVVRKQGEAHLRALKRKVERHEVGSEPRKKIEKEISKTERRLRQARINLRKLTRGETLNMGESQ